MSGDDPAFPSPFPEHTGLTKRELFAAMFGAGLCANPESPVANDIVVESVKLADRLIAELNKETKP